MIQLSYIYRSLFFIFFIILFYDPAGLLQLKFPIFIVIFSLSIYLLKDENISNKLLIYPSLFILLGIYGFILADIRYTDNDTYPANLELIKGFFSSLLIFIIYANKKYINDIVILINILSMITILLLLTFVYLLNSNQIDKYIQFYEYGIKNQIYYFEERNYGFINIKQMYFAVSPLILIGINHYFYKFFLIKKSYKNFLLLSLNILAIFLSGTRANILSFLILIFINSYFLIKNKLIKKIYIGFSILIAIVILINFFNVNEYSNNIKINLINNYFTIFYDLGTFLFGHGLGTYQFWGAYAGLNYYVTELTYFEIVRNFGFIFGILLIFLFISPLYSLFYQSKINKKFYGSLLLSYLILSFFNPNLLNFMGFLVFSICLVKASDSKNDK
jgi:hypothetical protein